MGKGRHKYMLKVQIHKAFAHKYVVGYLVVSLHHHHLLSGELWRREKLEQQRIIRILQVVRLKEV